VKSEHTKNLRIWDEVLNKFRCRTFKQSKRTKYNQSWFSVLSETAKKDFFTLIERNAYVIWFDYFHQ